MVNEKRLGGKKEYENEFLERGRERKWEYVFQRERERRIWRRDGKRGDIGCQEIGFKEEDEMSFYRKRKGKKRKKEKEKIRR